MMNNVNADYDTTTAMEAGIKLRKVLQRATGGWRYSRRMRRARIGALLASSPA